MGMLLSSVGGLVFFVWLSAFLKRNVPSGPMRMMIHTLVGVLFLSLSFANRAPLFGPAVAHGGHEVAEDAVGAAGASDDLEDLVRRQETLIHALERSGHPAPESR
ncbi:MAG: hypothetical protein KC466_11380 [Myxococcales bacterium]|nr:hypothetical protein [Myxococcales bacterium]